MVLKLNFRKERNEEYSVGVFDRILNNLGELSEQTKENKEKSSLIKFLDLASLGAGAYHGYCDAQGIPLKHTLEQTLTYGPTIVQTALAGAVGGSLMGLLCLTKDFTSFGNFNDKIFTKLTKKAGVTALGIVSGTAIAGTFGGAKGAVQTTVGYGLGYLAGHVTK